MECNKCSLAIDRKTERYTICEGMCAKRYHGTCIGLSEATMRALLTKNVLWMCDECLSDFCARRDDNGEEHIDTEMDDTSSEPTTIESDVAELKTKVEDIMVTLAAIVTQRTEQFSQLPCTKRHSTPVSPPVHDHFLLDGTRPYDVANTEGTSVSSERNESFALFLTNLECHTTEDHIGHLVRTSLGMADTEIVKVRKLVSKWNKCDERDYVSFKVTLNAEWKSLAMEPSTWPNGIKYREFQNRSFAWKPPM